MIEMTDYEKLKMTELVGVQEENDQLILQFQEGRRVIISIQDGQLQSQVS